MFRSIITKLWITIFALVFGILIFFSLFLSNRLEKIYFSHQVKLMNEHAIQWKTILQKDFSPEYIQREMVFWGRVTQYDLAVFDKNSIVLYSSDIDHFPVGKKSTWTHIRAGKENQEAYYTGFNPELNMEMTATFLPFTDNQGNSRLLMVHAPTHDLMEMIKATRSVGVLVFLAFLVLSGGLAWYFSHLIAKPIIRIRKAALGMAKGDFTTLAENGRDDELGDLAKTMNIMSYRLKNTLDSLSRSNAELSDLLLRWKEFVADVSHELRTPLFLVQGYSEAIIDNMAKDEKTKLEYLNIINKETLRLQKLVNDLLAVDSGIPLNKEKASLYRLALQSIIPFAILAKEKKVKIEVDKGLQQVEPVNLDPSKISEVLYNLVDNALRYTPENGKITIAGKTQHPNKVLLTVKDTGSGIPAEHLEHLFDRFYRVDKSRSRAQGGTGLGLSIVKKIVEQHNGQVSVESKVGEGTKFTITLPAED